VSDDLVKRLRCYADLNDAVFNPWVYGEAADRIEKLERENDDTALHLYAFASRIEKLETALREIALDDPDCCMIADRMRETAKIALGLKND